MKRSITMLILSLAVKGAIAQANLSFSYSNKAQFQLETGYVHERTGLLAAVGFASDKDTDPLVLFVKGGYEQRLGNDITLTGAVGAAKHNFYTGIKEEAYSEWHAIYCIELAKQWHNGQLFIGANKTGQLFFINVGCKVLIQK